MARTSDRLTERTVRTVRPPKGAQRALVNDGHGLYLVVRRRLHDQDDCTRNWVHRFRYPPGGPKHDHFLGPLDLLGLKEARQTRDEGRRLLRSGINPIAAAEKVRAANIADAAGTMTLGECIAAYIKAKTPGWTNLDHARQWTSSLARYVPPSIGRLPVDQVNTAHILKILQAADFWTTKPVTAGRVQDRIKLVLDWAAASGMRTGDNPAAWSHLKHLLPDPSKLKQVKQQPALDYKAMPEFVAKLKERSGFGSLALLFTIFTGLRSQDIRDAKRADIDLKVKVWNLPRLSKTNHSFRVPLSEAACDMIRQRDQLAADLGFRGDHLFFSTDGGQISDSTMLQVIARLGLKGMMSVHGARAALRTYGQEQTNHSREVLEWTLGHVLKGVEGRYIRDDLLPRRRAFLEQWSHFLLSPPQGDVVPLRRRDHGEG